MPHLRPRVEQHSISPGKDRCDRSDTQAEGEHSHNRESWALAKLSHSIDEILMHKLFPHSSMCGEGKTERLKVQRVRHSIICVFRRLRRLRPSVCPLPCGFVRFRTRTIC